MDIAGLPEATFSPVLTRQRNDPFVASGSQIAEVLAMIPDVHPELVPHRPRPVRETDEWLWESATEFCTALDRYAGGAMEIKRESTASVRASRPAHAVLHQSHTS